MTIFQFTPEEVMEIRVGDLEGIWYVEKGFIIMVLIVDLIVLQTRELFTIKKSLDLLGSMKHDWICFNVAILGIMDSIVETFILTRDLSTNS